jgi:hypothetical protein
LREELRGEGSIVSDWTMKEDMGRDIPLRIEAALAEGTTTGVHSIWVLQEVLLYVVDIIKHVNNKKNIPTVTTSIPRVFFTKIGNINVKSTGRKLVAKQYLSGGKFFDWFNLGEEDKYTITLKKFPHLE